ncbi:hydroxyacid dehydrogenase [Streptomyces sp. NPDC048507]|uniref:hydroxyacid dehydrogenase n=1 Tax=Streptomyces sp. NPDC048507 TaxID=3365560 RepID=UPI003724BED2
MTHHPTAAPARASRPATVLAMSPGTRDAVLSPRILPGLLRVADVDPGLLLTTFDVPDGARLDGVLARAEVLFTGWGCPPLDEEALRRMPRLRAVVHAAGSVKHHVTDACWKRGLLVSSAAAANALPVAEYTLAAILFANKRVLESAHAYRAARGPVDPLHRYPRAGNYRKTVGLIGASLIGRRVLELLRPFDLRVLVNDPYADPAEVAALDGELCSLDELLRRSHVVSLHAPSLPQTRHLLDSSRLGLMPDGATLINTARGSLVDTAALTEELVSGRLHAVLDHTEPEVLPATSPLFNLPNVLLTPHVAGSLGGELDRLAATAVEELERYARGLRFRHAVDPGRLAYSA